MCVLFGDYTTWAVPVLSVIPLFYEGKFPVALRCALESSDKPPPP